MARHEITVCDLCGEDIGPHDQNAKVVGIPKAAYDVCGGCVRRLLVTAITALPRRRNCKKCGGKGKYRTNKIIDEGNGYDDPIKYETVRCTECRP